MTASGRLVWPSRTVFIALGGLNHSEPLDYFIQLSAIQPNSPALGTILNPNSGSLRKF